MGTLDVYGRWAARGKDAKLRLCRQFPSEQFRQAVYYADEMYVREGAIRVEVRQVRQDDTGAELAEVRFLIAEEGQGV